MIMNSNFEKKLSGGKPFSLGLTVEVVKEVLSTPESFTEYLELFSCKDPQVVMRASNGLKRIFNEQPQWFKDQKSFIIDILKNCPHDSARWTLVQLLKSYKNYLNEDELTEAFAIARQFTLESTEWITLVQSMDLLISFKARLAPDQELRAGVEALTEDNRKAVANKATRLLEILP